MNIQKKYFNSSDARNLITHYGFALFPIHGIVDGKCTCGIADCSNPGKHPATVDGFKSATKDIERLKELWAGRSGLNVGIATGAISGIFVIDIDGEQGEKDLAALGIEIPETLTARTGRGRHIFFRHPSGNIKTRRGIIGDKVDVRGDGGYVAGVGSNHYSGSTYQWDNPLEDVAECPKALLDLVCKDTQKTTEIIAPPQTNRPMLRISNTWSESDVIDLLSYISPDVGYDEWIQLGMAIQSEGFGFHIWDNWSKGSDKYPKGGAYTHWKSFKPHGGVSFGTLVKMAQDGGWGKRASKSNLLQHKVDKYTTPIATDKKAESSQKNTGIKSDISANDKPQRNKLQYIKFADIQPNTETNDFVQGVLGENQLSVTYGESNCGKTFFMTDLAFHVATGMRWRDRRVDKGGVIYVALEGSYGLRNRVQAFKLKHGITEALFAMVPSQVDFLNPEGNIDEFIELLKQAAIELGGVKLVIIDTLSRAMAGGDENSGQDMGMLVYHADRIRYETGAHVNFVHHSGKNKALGARGHSSLRAAVDTEIEISREDGADYSVIKTVKQREMEKDEDMFFSLERIVIGVNGLSEEISSCVVKTLEKDQVNDTNHHKMVPLNSNESFLMDSILNCMVAHGSNRFINESMRNKKSISYDQLATEMYNSGYKDLWNKDGESKVKEATNAARLSLRDKNRIGFNSNFVWIIE